MSNRRHWLRIVSVILTGGCGGVPLQADVPSTELPGIAADIALASGTIELARCADQAVPSRIDAPGEIVVSVDADARLSLPVSGRVREVNVREGRHVEAGAPLIVFESAEVARARADVSILAVELRAAEAELERQKRLLANGVGLRVERLRAEAEVRRTEASLAAARSAALMYGAGEGGLVTLRAPMNGVVLHVGVRAGLVVTPDDGPVVSLAHTDALVVRLDVFEDELRRVALTQRVSVSAGDGSPAVQGTVVEVADAADSNSRRGPVLVELDSMPEGWVSGLRVRGRIDAAPVADVVLPVGAVVILPDRTRVVYVEENGRLVARRVHVGRVVDGLIPVLSGLRGDERVVVRGALLVDAMADRLL